MNKKVKILIYILLAAIWIIGTDFIIAQLNLDLQVYTTIQNIKALFFILLTSFFIYYSFIKQEESKAVTAEKEKLEALINSMVDFVNFKDGEGRWTQANDFALKLFQIDHVDYKGKKDSELGAYSTFYKEALEYCEVSDEEAWKIGKISRWTEKIPIPDGSTKTFDTLKIPHFYEDGTRKELVVVGRDITEQVIAEEQLEQKKQKYKSLIQYNPELVYILNAKGEVLELNPKFEVLTGYDPNDFIGKSIVSIISEKDKKEVKNAYLEILHKRRSIKNKEIEIIRKDGDKRILRCTAVPTVIENKVVGAIGYAHDITKETETEERLRKTEKLSVVGELAASVAHEIRNPLTSIKGFIQFMQSNDDKNGSYYKIMLDELERINQISSELLALGKPREIQFESCDINEIFTSVMWLLESQANLYSVEIDYISDKNLPLIDCEPNQLKQLFINIIKNSIEANSKKITVQIGTNEANQLQITIQDDGTGIDNERIERLGEPFYSSKEKGTGLGLTVSYKIIQSHRGHIQFNSDLNNGTRVTILLPIKSARID
ncbi:PAS domain-containing sensor histidine kinase [Alkalihalobacillus deserti]|uniref:PAS domain-containing sensor histidine kinase n=1 Tax=Alkalihalobacillus deserti TaxID=2879466 RepID=UPI001D149426|nr:PAS domain-containing sensor histidine kinase [Alkalihalobacillus deserti]